MDGWHFSELPSPHLQTALLWGLRQIMSSLSNCPVVKSCSETAANKLCSQFLGLQIEGSGVGGVRGAAAQVCRRQQSYLEGTQGHLPTTSQAWLCKSRRLPGLEHPRAWALDLRFLLIYYYCWMINNYHNIYQVTKHTFRPSNSLLIHPGAESGQCMTQGDIVQHYIAKAKHKASKQGGCWDLPPCDRWGNDAPTNVSHRT